MVQRQGQKATAKYVLLLKLYHRKYRRCRGGSPWLSGSRHQRSLGHGLSPSTPITAVPGNTPSDSDSLQNASGVSVIVYLVRFGNVLDFVGGILECKWSGGSLFCSTWLPEKSSTLKLLVRTEKTTLCVVCEGVSGMYVVLNK